MLDFLANAYFFTLFILVALYWYLTELLIFISLMTDGVEHLLQC